MKHRKHTKLIALVLTLALAITGVSFGDAMTAQAATTKWRDGIDNIRDLADTTITMKIGDEKKLDILVPTLGYDDTKRYIWTCSDESIVKMDRVYAENSGTETLELYNVKLIALKTGTVTVTATKPSNGETVSVTVKVTKPKLTAKQKKCKHKFKVTKKATCKRYGMQTCKKCKLQKVIPQKQHSFETVTEQRYDYEYKAIYVCGGCTCEDRRHYTCCECPNYCEELFDEDDYGSDKAAHQAMDHHKVMTDHYTKTWYFYQVPIDRKLVYKEVTKCKSCNTDKLRLDLIDTPNDPDKTIWLNDL